MYCHTRDDQRSALCPLGDDNLASQLTFSIPKNLSLPSFRTGPESCSIFSRGVIGGAWGSFFGGLAPEAGAEGPCMRSTSQQCLLIDFVMSCKRKCRQTSVAAMVQKVQTTKARTALPLRFLKNDPMFTTPQRKTGKPDSSGNHCKRFMKSLTGRLYYAPPCRLLARRQDGQRFWRQDGRRRITTLQEREREQNPRRRRLEDESKGWEMPRSQQWDVECLGEKW